MDTMYSIGAMVPTIDPSWGKVIKSDSYKWQHVILNLKNPYFGTGINTPLGRSAPSRAAEAAMNIRHALSVAVPRERIINQTLQGYGVPAIVPVAYTAPEYNRTLLKPIPYDIDLAKSYMEKAGFSYKAAPPPGFMELYGNYLVAALVVVILVIAAVAYQARKRSRKT
jgi:ABC-type transport system substrate-binding protein